MRTEPPEEFEVPETLSGERVDRTVALVTGWSRAEVQALLERGDVLVGGVPAAKSRRLEAGEIVSVLDVPPIDAPPQADASVPVVVRHEDPHLFVVAKPAGLVVHPGAGHPGGTLVNGLLALDPSIASVGDAARPGIVHRLDRDTSGLLVVARTQAAYEGLVAALADRRVDRAYDALVWGVPDARRGVIDAPIGRSVHRRTRMAVSADGREARTRYEVLRTWTRPSVSLLECHLETGRTHQIRVHLAAIGHAVVGDATYGGARQSVALDRPFLHARHLAFDHPVTGEWVEVDEPDPPDLVAVLDALE